MPYWITRAILPTLFAGIKLTGGQLYAQSGDDSPYSSYGFGDLIGPSQVSQVLMGGVGVGITDPFSTISVNPASYAALERPSFEVGGTGRFVTLSTAEQRVQRRNARFLGLTVGLPDHKKNWGLAFGVHPVSEVGYLIEDHATLSDGTDVRFEYSGAGGLNRAFAGAGATIWQQRDSTATRRRLTAGANFSYLFGSIDHQRKAYYPNGVGFANANFFSSLVLRAPSGNVGMQFTSELIPAKAMAERIKLRTERRAVRIAHRNRALPDSLHRVDPRTPRQAEPWRWMIGLAWEAPTSFGATSSDLATSFVVINNIEFQRDTISSSSNVTGTVELPAAYGIGASVFDSRWTIAADVRFREWRDLKIDVDGYQLPAGLATNITYALGASFRPVGERSGGGFLERSIWRAGVRYSQDYLVVQGNQLHEMGVSAGVSLPVLGSISRSRLTLGADLGRRGDEQRGTISERFIDLFVGITITPDFRERWLEKRRIE